MKSKLPLNLALALSALPCLYYRERHDTLMSQWLLLWGLHLFINVPPELAAPETETLRQKIFRVWDARTRGYMALLGVTGMIHPYMLFMVAAIWSGEVLRGLWPVVTNLRDKSVWPKKLWGVVWRAGAVLACPLVTLGIAGAYERGQSPAAGGWSYYSMGLDALFNPVRSDFSAILKAWPLDGGQSFEGYQYLGFGILCLLAIAAALYALTPEAKAARPFLRKLTPLALPFLALFLIAVTNHAQFYGYTVWKFDVPQSLRGTLGILRASGRFFWPISYLMVAAALVVLFKSRPRVVAAVLPAVLLLQAYDINGLAAAMRKATGLAEYSQTYYLTPSPIWDELVKRSTGVDFYPVNVHLNDKLFYELTYRATTDAKPVNTMYPARENLTQIAYEYRGEDAFRGGQVNPRHLLVFLKQCDAPASLQPRLRMLDGVWIIPPADAADLNLPKPQWSPIRSRSPAMRIAPSTERRSSAIGWRRAISVMARESSSRWRSSMTMSSETTRCASATSADKSAFVAPPTIVQASSPIPSMICPISRRSSSKDATVCSAICLPRYPVPPLSRTGR